MTEVYNFAAGPAVLPASVIKQMQAELPSFKDSGMSVLEISHRSSLYEEMFHQAKSDLRKLMKIPDTYEILFQQGGATLQFTATALNLATKQKRIGLIDSGHWSQRAGQEAQLVGVEVDPVASGQASGYTELPYQLNLTGAYDYLHITTNNTIEGTMYRRLPATEGNLLVGDMSSNILGQSYDVNDFGLIYAGAQKNIGPAGLTIVIVKKDLLGQAQALPAMLDYSKQAKKDSALNTPPVFAIYAAGLVFKWLLDLGGVAAMQERNEKKAALLYDYLDNSTLFKPAVTKVSDRSTTNVPFVTGDEALDARFIKEATAQGLLNLKGHRLVRGMRASLYNAFPYEGVEALVTFMEKFAKTVGEK